MPVLTERGRLVRQRIIVATAEQILLTGVGGTTLDSVRAATLTSKSQLFHYFPGGKAELVREVVSWDAEQLMAAQQPFVQDLTSWASWTAWRGALERYYFDLGRWACPIGSLAFEAATTDAELAGQIAELLAGWQSLVADGIGRMQASGLMRNDSDPRRLASSLIAAVQGGLLMAQVERSPWPLEAAIDTAFTGLASARVDATGAAIDPAAPPPSAAVP